MNNDIKYAVNGVLLTALFFISLRFISFILSIQETSNNESTFMVIGDGTSQPTIQNIDPKLKQGKEIFMSNCAACHAINKQLTGPALAGIEERVPNKKILYAWIKNNEQVLKSGNKYFTNLYNTYNKTPMNIFSNLTDEDIDAILFYINAQREFIGLPIASTL